MTETRPLAVVDDYLGLITALRARVAELGVAVGGVGPGSAARLRRGKHRLPLP